MPTEDALAGVKPDRCEGLDIFRIFLCAIAESCVSVRRQRAIRLSNEPKGAPLYRRSDEV